MENLLINQDLQEVRDNFSITDLEGANWAFRKLRAIEQKEVDIIVLAEAEKNRIKVWEEKERASLQQDKEYFSYLITEYYNNQKAVDKKFKLSTPYGKVTSRKAKTWNYQEEELKEYLKVNEPELIRVKEEINKTELKKVFKDGVNASTGEILPFVEIIETETISVKVEV